MIVDVHWNVNICLIRIYKLDLILHTEAINVGNRVAGEAWYGKIRVIRFKWHILKFKKVIIIIAI